MRQVKFTMAASPYNRGEVAGFPDEEATRLVSDGKAVFEEPTSSPASEREAYSAPVDRMQRRAHRKAVGV